MEKQSIFLPIVLTIMVSAVIFGGLGYYFGNGTQITTTISPSPSVSAEAMSTDEALIHEALTTYCNTQCGPDIKPFKEDSRVIKGDYARVVLVPTKSSSADSAIAYLKRINQQWTIVSLGTGGDNSVLLKQNGFPAGF